MYAVIDDFSVDCSEILWKNINTIDEGVEFIFAQLRKYNFIK
jgi:hypothetical protein